MKNWAEIQAEIRIITADKARAESLLNMAAIRADALQSLDAKRYASIIVEGYYEVIKELLTALMCLEGHKTN